MAIFRRVVTFSNPEPCGGRKPAEQVTDRALRYRANSDECQPSGSRRCAYCGSTRQIQVGHIDGDETHTVPENLNWTCRSCNQHHAVAMKKLGRGRRTKQYNPKRRRGASDYREYARALGILDGSAIGDIDSAVELIHSTPASKRSEFQKDIWAVRKERYGPSGRKDGGAVPF